jgi:hypothetical protein
LGAPRQYGGSDEFLSISPVRVHDLVVPGGSDCADTQWLGSVVAGAFDSPVPPD